MRHTILRLTIILLLAAVVAPALAQESCPDTCPAGTVRSLETGKCEPFEPMTV